MSAVVITPIAGTVRSYRLDEALPEPLHDVLIEVALVPGDDPEVYLGYRTDAGGWCLTGSDALSVTPSRWAPIPTLAELRADPVELVARFAGHQAAESETCPPAELVQEFMAGCTDDESDLVTAYLYLVDHVKDEVLLAHARRHLAKALNST
jgi:hypothetical protein